MRQKVIRKVAVIGAGASGAAAAAALKAEDYFDNIQVFERKGTPGGTWIYDRDPGNLPFTPGALPPQVDKPLTIPDSLPTTTAASTQHRYDKTPIYEQLTTNVPDVAMSFTDLPFAYGPFVPHWIPKQYLENYFSCHHLDQHLRLNTTVEDMTALKNNRWRLILRRYDAARHVDDWWQEEFDAVVIANGHYSVPFIPYVPGINEYREKFPDRIVHSKVFRTAREFAGQRVMVIGNSASGYDVAHILVASKVLKGPVYVSRRSPGRWDGKDPPEGMLWKPIITSYNSDDGSITFSDGTVISEIDKIIYCTGYQPSYPFWNTESNGRPLYFYKDSRLINNYQHTFIRDFPTLAFIGIPRVLTFRSFEYQAVAIARLWSGRSSRPFPSIREMKDWEEDRAKDTKIRHAKFHQIEWTNGETMDWFRWLFEFAGLPQLEGYGRCPPVLGEATRWAIEHIKKYPEGGDQTVVQDGDEDWEVVRRKEEDALWFL
ncbi:Thiol-specific monooxygenase [Pseudocercospora fuligena]|uniref:Thiol-specific monooxygenase n=1 Tax=Pseudocercospora fuligena TaxID=685502 RepID=A0A8H6RTY4_9PEZI|nr:Thiol-specific monooxygenase [Pseudocercospora fuligena]